MHFTLKQLRYFDAALRTGSIAKAADEMNISQSSITAAINQMEDLIGLDLFRRIPAKGIVPTDEGRAVGARVADFMEQARTFENDLMSMAGTPSGNLHLACYAPSAPFILPRLLKKVTEAHPQIRIDLKEGDMPLISEFMSAGSVDLALTYRRSLPEGAPFLPLFRARPFALIPESWELANKAAVQLEELSDLPMIMLDLPTAQPYFKSIFERDGRPMNVTHTTKSSSVLRGLVAANFGFSILNIYGQTDRTGMAGYVARPILGDVEEPLFGIAYTTASRRSPIVQAVLEIAENLAKNNAFADLRLGPERALGRIDAAQPA